jgi:hypothetical protein
MAEQRTRIKGKLGSPSRQSGRRPGGQKEKSQKERYCGAAEEPTLARGGPTNSGGGPSSAYGRRAEMHARVEPLVDLTLPK